MAADVRSIAEVRDFHSALGVYRSSLLEALGGVDMEVRRAFEWLSEMASLWQRRVRDTQDEVVQAKADLAARKFPDYNGRMPDCSVQEENLRRAKAKLEFCEDQVRRCKSWINKLPKQVEEAYTGPARRLQNFLEVNLPNGLSLLSRQIAALEAYADLRADYAPAPSAATLPAATTSVLSPPVSAGGKSFFTPPLGGGQGGFLPAQTTSVREGMEQPRTPPAPPPRGREKKEAAPDELTKSANNTPT